MKFRQNLGGAVVLGLLLSIGGMAQTQMDEGAHKMAKSADAMFATNAAQGGTAEVELGQLALQNASSSDVKAFAQHMIDDHTKANDQLKQIASQEGMTLPETLNQKDVMLKSKLQNAKGAKFDKEYMKAMVKDHEEDVKEFQKEAQNGSDPAIKNFAAQTLPTLQGHLEMAKGTDAKVK